MKRYCDRCAGQTDAAKMIVFKIFKPHQEPLTYYVCRDCLVSFAKWMEEEE